VADELHEVLGRQVANLVAARDPERLQPVAVDHRRARMRDRMAHHAGFFHYSGENEVDLRMRHSWLWCAPSSRLLARYSLNAGSAISASRFFSRSAWLAYFHTCTTWFSGPTSVVA